MLTGRLTRTRCSRQRMRRSHLFLCPRIPGKDCALRLGRSEPDECHRCLYSVYLMHRRTDLWGPDGASSSLVPPTLASTATSLADDLLSGQVRPRPLHRRAPRQVPHAQPVHFRSLQRGSAYMPRPAGKLPSATSCSCRTLY